jgi:hypothetical protein
MKTKFIITGVLLASVVALWCLSHRYEFHTDTFHAYDVTYPVMWRCDRLTGTVEKSDNGANWQKVQDQAKLDIRPWTPPVTDPIITPAKHDVFDEVDTNSPKTNTALPDFGNK